MPMESSVNDVFRFVQLRPKRPLGESAPVPLQDDTSLAKTLLQETSPAGRASTANMALKTGQETVGGVSDLPLGAEIVAALSGLREDPDTTTDDLVQKVPELSSLYSDSTAGERYLALSNTLFASLYATEYLPRDLAALPDVYRIYRRFLQKNAGEAESLASLLSRPLLAPVPERGGDKTPPSGPTASSPDIDADKLTKAMQEIGRLDRHEHLVQPTTEGLPSQGALPFTFTASARQKLSTATQDVLVKRGLDLAVLHPEVAVQALGAELGYLADTVVDWPAPVVTTQPGVTLPPPPTLSLVKPAGLADLLVVKQQIKRYEAGEIAHVENVLTGEKKSRAHRRLERSEETFSSDSEVTREQQTELETADRFELSRETSRTIEEDRQTSLGLSLSGKYGPTVEFSSNFTLDSSTSSEESTKSSSRFARDVVSRSLERLTERAREQRSRTVIRETEETNLHELHNETGGPVSGVYQFLDKVYEAQIFNYGVRQMFDFMVPEPASFLWHMEQNPSLDLQLPPPPPDLHAVAPTAGHITEQNALRLAAAFGATDIEAPPPLYKVLTVGLKHGGEDSSSEEGHPRSGQRVEAQVPPGYRPLRARIRGLALTDDQPTVAIVIGGQKVVWSPATASGVDLGEDHRLHHQPELFLSLAQEPYELTADSKLGVAAVAWETNTYALDVVIVLQRTAEELGRWRLATYKKIRAAYDDAVRRHEQKVTELRAEAEARVERESRRPFGGPPAENTRTIVAELKKHCLSLLTEQRYDAFDAVKPGTPPWFDFLEAAAEGGYIRFFEQAFEWDQMQYVFYPYFWARKASWAERFAKQDVDPRFLEFLKAGAARVVVPVRPGFEVAVTHFLETGRIWGGEGEPPPIHSPLYLSIIDEIRERTGAPQGEIAVGDPWEVRVPTALVRIRDHADLPSWERVAPGEWSWRPVPEA